MYLDLEDLDLLSVFFFFFKPFPCVLVLNAICSIKTNNESTGTRDVAKWVECLISMHKALGSFLSTIGVIPALGWLRQDQKFKGDSL